MVQLRRVAANADGPGEDGVTLRTACTTRARRLHEAVSRPCNTVPEGSG
jgi:hypothetical protein